MTAVRLKALAKRDCQKMTKTQALLILFSVVPAVRFPVLDDTGKWRPKAALHSNGQGTARSTWCVDLQNFVPLALVLEHDLAEEANRRHAVVEQFIMELLQRKVFALLRFVIVAQF